MTDNRRLRKAAEALRRFDSLDVSVQIKDMLLAGNQITCAIVNLAKAARAALESTQEPPGPDVETLAREMCGCCVTRLSMCNNAARIASLLGTAVTAPRELAEKYRGHLAATTKARRRMREVVDAAHNLRCGRWDDPSAQSALSKALRVLSGEPTESND